MKTNEYNCAVKHFLEKDVLIYQLMSRFGATELKIRRNYFLHLITSIIGQQLSIQSANAIKNKLFNYFKNDLTPESISNTKISILRSLGLSNAKANYIKDLSDKLLSGEVKLNGISKKNETDIAEELMKVNGIGPWTVHMFLIFVLGKPNILPVGDLGIKKAIVVNYNLKFLPTSEEVLKLSQKNNWAPYNSFASLYLWKSIDGN